MVVGYPLYGRLNRQHQGLRWSKNMNRIQIISEQGSQGLREATGQITETGRWYRRRPRGLRRCRRTEIGSRIPSKFSLQLSLVNNLSDSHRDLLSALVVSWKQHRRIVTSEYISDRCRTNQTCPRTDTPPINDHTGSPLYIWKRTSRLVYSTTPPISCGPRPS